MDDWLDLLKSGVAGVIEGELGKRYAQEPQIVLQGQSGAVQPVGQPVAQVQQTVAGVPVLWIAGGLVALVLVGALVMLARR